MRQLTVVAFVLLSTCAHDETPAPGESLLPYPGSKVTQQVPSAIAYEVSVPYPAEPVLEFIAAHVPPGFQPRKEDFMNPGVPTSHVRGWTSYGDETTRPPAWVHHWTSQWEDAAGNILSYDLMYRSPRAEFLDRPTSTNLHVIGHYYSRELVAEIKKSLPANRQSEVDPKPPIAVTKADYVVLRPLSTEKRAGAQEVSRDGTSFYFDPADVLIDLSHVHSVETSTGPSGSPVVFVETSDAGAAKLKAWTSSNVGRHLGVFLDGRLIAAPIVASRLSGTFILDGQFTEEQAENIAARIRRGGA